MEPIKNQWISNNAPAVSTYVYRLPVLPRIQRRTPTYQPPQAEFRADNRSSWERLLSHARALLEYERYQRLQRDLKAQEGFNNLMRLISPSTYVEGLTGLDLGPVGRFAVDMAVPGAVGGATRLFRAAGKGAMRGATRAATREMAPTGIRASARTDEWERILASYRQAIDDYRAMGKIVPPSFLDNVKELEHMILQAKAAEYSIGPVLARENLPKALGPLYNGMANSKFITFDAGPYVETTVGTQKIIPFGTLHPGAYSQYRADKMLKDLAARRYDINELGFYNVRGLKVVGSASKLVPDMVSKPSTLYLTRTPNTTGGFYNIPSGKTYVKVTPYSTGKDVRLTDIHEGVAHATDDFIDDFTKGIARQEYADVATAVENAGFNSAKGSNAWYELRATLFEMHKQMADAIRESVKGSYGVVEGYLNKSIDKMSYQKFADIIEGINNYGKDYAAYIRQNPMEVNRFKNLLKNGLVWGTPVGLTGMGMVPQEKKGGKTHKPFGHRSILDNGWQSTKQLKNTKNVYSKK